MLMFSLPCFAVLLSAVLAATTITTYSNTDCTQEISVVTPPENRECQNNTLGAFLSFQVTDPTPSCNVTWHGSDYSYCASDYKGQLQINVCYDNLTFFTEFPSAEFLGAKFPVTEFTVDCDQSVIFTALGGLSASSSFPAGTVPTSVGGSSNTPTTSLGPSPSSDTNSGGGGLSSKAKAGIAAAGTIGGLFFAALMAFLGIKGHQHHNETRRQAQQALDREADRDRRQAVRDAIEMDERNRRNDHTGGDQAVDNDSTANQAAESSHG